MTITLKWLRTSLTGAALVAGIALAGAGTASAEVSASTPVASSVSTAGSQDTQVKPFLFEITQDVTVNKARTADKAFQWMDVYMRG